MVLIFFRTFLKTYCLGPYLGWDFILVFWQAYVNPVNNLWDMQDVGLCKYSTWQTVRNIATILIGTYQLVDKLETGNSRLIQPTLLFYISNVVWVCSCRSKDWLVYSFNIYLAINVFTLRICFLPISDRVLSSKKWCVNLHLIKTKHLKTKKQKYTYISFKPYSTYL